jgi:NADH-quinone oxidoreductase subunit J
MELTLFVIVGAVAVIAAAMMLISENAIYSALFLILNFACIAFFFLMLNAVFLAMVQIAVYAGAIMVLFLFVIMLLGAERVLPEARPRFRWLTPVAVVLALIFLITTSVAVIDGKIDLTNPQPTAPQIRVVHGGVAAGAAVDAYLDGDRIVQDLAFGKGSGFEEWQPGRYTLTVFPVGADPDTTNALIDQDVELNAGDVLSFTIVGAVGDPDVVVVAEDVDQISDKDKLRVVVVNSLHARGMVDVEIGNALIEGVPEGAASATTLIEKGTFTVNVFSQDNRRLPIVSLKDQEFKADTSELWVLTEEPRADNAWNTLTISLETEARPAFGSPAHVGQILFTKYVLPFELVALLLLVAMIGAIVLTHESLGPRRRTVRRLANPPAGLDQPVAGETGK